MGKQRNEQKIKFCAKTWTGYKVQGARCKVQGSGLTDHLAENLGNIDAKKVCDLMDISIFNEDGSLKKKVVVLSLPSKTPIKLPIRW